MGEKTIIANKAEVAKENSTAFSGPASANVDSIKLLHQTLGNQTVGRMLQQSGVGKHQSIVDSRKSSVIQAKLKIGQPNDLYEQEADRVADTVMRMPDTEVMSPEAGAGSWESGVRGGSGIIQTKPG